MWPTGERPKDGTYRSVRGLNLAALEDNPMTLLPTDPATAISMLPSSVPTFEVPRNVDAEGDGTKPWRPTQSPSPDSECSLTIEKHETGGMETRTTPKSRRLTNTTSSHKDRTRDNDPDWGRCFITNRPTPVRLYHFVSQATDRDTVRVCAWQMYRLYPLILSCR